MRYRIMRYRRSDAAARAATEIGCRIITQPFFLSEERWLDPPPSWSPTIVSFKGYSTDEIDGSNLWEAAQAAMQGAANGDSGSGEPRYGEPVLIRPRLG